MSQQSPALRTNHLVGLSDGALLPGFAVSVDALLGLAAAEGSGEAG